MNVLVKSILLLSCFLLAQACLASPSEFNFKRVGSVPYYVRLNDGTEKKVMLDKIATPENYQALALTNELFTIIDDSSLPPKLFLDTSTPVLDQGSHGTCATFATIGVVDEALEYYKHGDNNLISPMCTLQMIQSITQDKEGAWDGFWESRVIHYLKQYGDISNEKALTGICNTQYRQYPTNSNSGVYSNLNNLQQYRTNSRHENGLFIKSVDQSVAWDPVHIIKQDLNKYQYSLAGFYVVDTKTTLEPDNMPIWVYGNKEKFNVGHAVWFYGYDDNKCVEYLGKKQCGVLYFRNSWGPKAGNNGNYAMSYAYARHFIHNKIIAIGSSINHYDVGTTKNYFGCASDTSFLQVVDQNGTNTCNHDWHKCADFLKYREQTYCTTSRVAVCCNKEFRYSAK